RGNWDQVGPWSDVFALGGLLYFLLARRAPFAAPTRDAALHRAARCELDNSPLQAARVPRSLQAICLRALAANPADRYPGAAELAAELERFARGPVWTRRAAVAALVLAPVAAVVWRPWSGSAPSLPEPLAPPAHQELVQVMRRNRPMKSLRAAIPLGRGDKIRIVCEVPKDAQAAVFWLGSEGSLEELRGFRLEPGGASDQLLYPAGVKRPPGNEFALVVANRAGRPLPSLQEIQALLAEPDSRSRDPQPKWPALPDNTLLWLRRDEVRADWEEEHRSVGDAEQNALT